MKVVAIVAARMASTRLPGKHLMDLGGRPMLAHVLERAKAIAGVDEVVLATTMNSDDDALLPVCEAAGVPMFRRNHPNDVLARYADCAKLHQADVVVRLTADCPLLDPHLAALALDINLRVTGYTITTIEASEWLDGLDVEVFRGPTLRAAHLWTKTKAGREHVTPWMREKCRPCKVLPLDGERAQFDRLPAAWRKWSVDTPEDLARVRAIVAHQNTEGYGDLWYHYAFHNVEAALRAAKETV